MAAGNENLRYTLLFHAQLLVLLPRVLLPWELSPTVLITVGVAATLYARGMGRTHPVAPAGRRDPRLLPARPLSRVRGLRPLPADLSRHRPTARRSRGLVARGIRIATVFLVVLARMLAHEKLAERAVTGPRVAKAALTQ